MQLSPSGSIGPCCAIRIWMTAIGWQTVGQEAAPGGQQHGGQGHRSQCYSCTIRPLRSMYEAAGAGHRFCSQSGAGRYRQGSIQVSVIYHPSFKGADITRELTRKLTCVGGCAKQSTLKPSNRLSCTPSIHAVVNPLPYRYLVLYSYGFANRVPKLQPPYKQALVTQPPRACPSLESMPPTNQTVACSSVRLQGHGSPWHDGLGLDRQPMTDSLEWWTIFVQARDGTEYRPTEHSTRAPTRAPLARAFNPKAAICCSCCSDAGARPAVGFDPPLGGERERAEEHMRMRNQSRPAPTTAMTRHARCVDLLVATNIVRTVAWTQRFCHV